MLIKKVNGRIQHRIDSEENWKSGTSLLKGEIGVALDSSGKVEYMGFGNSDTEVALTTLEQQQQVFYSGKGAGYELLPATTDKIGGVIINKDYYDEKANTLTPRYIVKLNEKGFRDHVKQFYPETEIEDYDEYNIFLMLTNAPDQTYKLNLGLNGDFYINRLKAQTIEHISIEDHTISKQYLELYTSEDPVPPLSEDQYIGIRFRNYTSDPNIYAQLSIDNSGILYFFPQFNENKKEQVITLSSQTTTDEKQLLSLTRENGKIQLKNNPIYTLTVKQGDKSIVYDPLGNKDKEIEIPNVPEAYCEKIEFDGKEYEPDDNNIITLPPNFAYTEDDKAKVDSAVQKAIFNEKEIIAQNQSLDLESVKNYIDTKCGSLSEDIVTKVGELDSEITELEKEIDAGLKSIKAHNKTQSINNNTIDITELLSTVSAGSCITVTDNNSGNYTVNHAVIDWRKPSAEKNVDKNTQIIISLSVDETNHLKTYDYITISDLITYIKKQLQDG